MTAAVLVQLLLLWHAAKRGPAVVHWHAARELSALAQAPSVTRVDSAAPAEPAYSSDSAPIWRGSPSPANHALGQA